MDDTARTIYVIIQYTLSVAIILGNTLTLLSIMRNKFLQTRMNVFVGHLAFADLIVGLFAIPIDSMFYINPDIDNKFLCYVRYSLQVISSGMSTICLSFICLDRYIGVIHPLRYRIILSNLRIKILVALMWTITIFSATLPHIVNWTSWTPGLECEFQLVYKTQYQIYLIPILMIFILVPCPGYMRIFWEVRKQKRFAAKHEQHSGNMTDDSLKGSQKTFRMAVVFILFIIFWIPYVVISVIRLRVHTELVLIACKWSILLFNANSVVNPIVYGVLSKNFRHAYKNILLKCTCCKKKIRRVTPEINFIMSER